MGPVPRKMMDRRKQAAKKLDSLRAEWECEHDLATLRRASPWCRYHPMPDWLADALKRHFDDVLTSPREKQQRHLRDIRSRMVLAVRNAFYSDQAYPVFYALPDETPSERHFRAACDQLNEEGWGNGKITPASVKKAWQRHKPLIREELLAIILE